MKVLAVDFTLPDQSKCDVPIGVLLEYLARASIPRMPTCTAVIMGLPHDGLRRDESLRGDLPGDERFDDLRRLGVALAGERGRVKKSD